MYAVVVQRPFSQEGREKQEKKLWERFKTVFSRVQMQGSCWWDIIYLPIQCSPTWRLPKKEVKT